MSVTVTNYNNSDTVRYSLPLLIGEVKNCEEGEIIVKNRTNGGTQSKWPVIFGKFKALVFLLPGLNQLAIIHDNHVLELSLVYKPLNFRRFLRLVYVLCQDDAEGRFQALPNEPDTIHSASDRLSLGASMLQTFTAEELKYHGLEPKTFRLEEKEGKIVCHIFKSSLRLNQALKMSEGQLWEHLAVELMTSNLRQGNDCKFLAILSFTRYLNPTPNVPKTFKEIKAHTRGYAALATGGLALLGSACLHTWPQSLQEVSWRFGDCRMIDRMHFMDESANRGTHWACYTSTLGATLHELGHVFDLGHTRDGIMSRGFDDINKFFTIDLFYYSHPFQKKYNPYYMNLGSDSSDQSIVNIERSLELLWYPTPEASNGNSVLSVTKLDGNIKPSQTKPTRRNYSNKSKVPVRPPWRIPNPPEPGCDNAKAANSNAAHWARSSALLLYYHQWFNDVPNEDQNSRRICQTGLKFASAENIRIAEFRDSEGLAFHHLEFQEGAEEVDFTPYVKNDLPENVLKFQIIVEDSVGNIITKSFDAEAHRT